jgi:hypothetical protein
MADFGDGSLFASVERRAIRRMEDDELANIVGKMGSRFFSII